MNYEELVKALRICSSELNCGDCPLLYRDSCSSDELMADAAAAIEELQAEVDKWQDVAYQDSLKQMKMQERIWELEAEVERYKRLNNALENLLSEDKEPKRGEMVDVVRCKDCDSWDTEHSSGRKSLGNYVCICQEWSDGEDARWVCTGEDEFCSRGERRAKMEVQE